MERIKALCFQYKYWMIGIVSIILCVSIYVFLLRHNFETTIDTEGDLVFKEEEVPVEEEEKQIKVDIKGAVTTPGVYTLAIGSRVSDIIALSGGLLEVADTSMINLSKILVDQDVVIIYTKSEIEEMRTGSVSVKYIESECICPKIENNACIQNPITNKEEERQEEVPSTPTIVSINQASLEQLETLPGIGSKKAQAIIDYRVQIGGFQTIEQIMEVKGIGEATFEKLKPYLTL